MIDLHSHILPGIDDGAADLRTSLAMAEAFVADGVRIVAATPHILPGVYANAGPDIRARVAALQVEIDRHGIPLTLATGADLHVAPRMVAGLVSGHLLSLADTRYVLVEPPHKIAPPRLEDTFFELLVAGYVPILTHPERLTWLHEQFDMVKRLAQSGVWMQITSGSLRGVFGSNAQRWAERMLDEGLVDILATDAHDMTRRCPDLSAGFWLAAERIGEEDAWHLVLTRPQAILENRPPSEVPRPRARRGAGSTRGAAARGRAGRHGSDGDDNAFSALSGCGRIGRLTQRLRQLFG